ncbi:hypothetical protein ACFVYT_00320 [Streptomyces sp. NPDC058290]|uniref:hypothetical protein n=1 Tax=Streptomyces sp. NPDC058290 TaxID=3346426 RepID=UPI0036E9FCDE
MTRRAKPLDCAACGAGVRRGKYRLCMLGCGARLHTDKRSPCIDAHIPVCDAYQPHPEAIGGTVPGIDLYLTAYGATIAALRDDDTALRELLAGLDPAELAGVTEGVLLTMASTVREAIGPDATDQIITAVQALAYTDSHEGTPS